MIWTAAYTLKAEIAYQVLLQQFTFCCLVVITWKCCFLGYNLMGSVMQVEPSTVSKRRWAYSFDACSIDLRCCEISDVWDDVWAQEMKYKWLTLPLNKWSTGKHKILVKCDNIQLWLKLTSEKPLKEFPVEEFPILLIWHSGADPANWLRGGPIEWRAPVAYLKCGKRGPGGLGDGSPPVGSRGR